VEDEIGGLDTVGL